LPKIREEFNRRFNVLVNDPKWYQKYNPSNKMQISTSMLRMSEEVDNKEPPK